MKRSAFLFFLTLPLALTGVHSSWSMPTRAIGDGAAALIEFASRLGDGIRPRLDDVADAAGEGAERVIQILKPTRFRGPVVQLETAIGDYLHSSEMLVGDQGIFYIGDAAVHLMERHPSNTHIESLVDNFDTLANLLAREPADPQSLFQANPEEAYRLLLEIRYSLRRFLRTTGGPRTKLSSAISDLDESPENFSIISRRSSAYAWESSHALEHFHGAPDLTKETEAFDAIFIGCHQIERDLVYRMSQVQKVMRRFVPGGDLFASWASIAKSGGSTQQELAGRVRTTLNAFAEREAQRVSTLRREAGSRGWGLDSEIDPANAANVPTDAPTGLETLFERFSDAQHAVGGELAPSSPARAPRAPDDTTVIDVSPAPSNVREDGALVPSGRGSSSDDQSWDGAGARWLKKLLKGGGNE